jgi:oligopeptide/dipeptide ABC transporter ATP-binding protein
MNEPLVRIEHLKKTFTSRRSLFNLSPLEVKAVDDVSLQIAEGQTMGLVGESGCGKSTLGRTLLNLIEPTSGSVFYRGKNIYDLSRHEMWKLKKEMQVIFQDPYSSLNPRMNVEELVVAPLKVYSIGSDKEQREKVVSMLEEVGMRSYILKRYPHEFSGGQRQRIMITRALILNPEFVVCDEPVSALDVSVRAQVLNLMKNLQQQKNLTYLFISHDLSVVRHISDRIAVMYLGSLTEVANRDDLYRNPLHPYTRSLLSSIPVPNPRKRKELKPIQGEMPSAYKQPSGCKFHTRCPYVRQICWEIVPEMREYQTDHLAACHRIGEF